jgi:Eukaryotic-type carbonic anhydrase
MGAGAGPQRSACGAGPRQNCCHWARRLSPVHALPRFVASHVQQATAPFSASSLSNYTVASRCQAEARLPGRAAVLSLLPQPQRSGRRPHVHYVGSLTTPPCSEGVDWFVFADTVGVTDSQVAADEAGGGGACFSWRSNVAMTHFATFENKDE